MAKITGRVEVLVNGEILLNKEGAVASGLGISGQPNFEKEAIGGPGGLHGFKETFVPATLEVSITDRDDVSLDKLARVNGDGTIVFRTAGSGKVYTMHDATNAGNISLTAGEGETKLKFIGPFWTESVSS
jgi:hypothetical protein